MNSISIPKSLFRIIGIALICLIVAGLTIAVIKEVVKREAIKAKTEIIEKIKTAENFNDRAAAERILFSII